MAGNREISTDSRGTSDELAPSRNHLPKGDWRTELGQAVRDPAELLDRLELPDSLLPAARKAAADFPLVVPHSYLWRMQIGRLDDPLLMQVLPVADELDDSDPSLLIDPVGDSESRVAPGLLHKYYGRALLITTGTCAIHCRYCFRRHYPYGDEPKSFEDWNPAFEALENDSSIDEIILSGGDPLVLGDSRLRQLVERLAAIPHLKRLRIHTRLPIVLPARVTPELIATLRDSRLQPVMVVHSNHSNEVAGDCAEALKKLVTSGIPTLNQAVLLRGINDSLEDLEALCLAMGNVGVMPYYLHQFDRVRNAGHFEVPAEKGLALVEELRGRLPGYLVPQFVKECAGRNCKTPLNQQGLESLVEN